MDRIGVFTTAAEATGNTRRIQASHSVFGTPEPRGLARRPPANTLERVVVDYGRQSFELASEEVECIEDVISELRTRHESIETPEFQRECAISTTKLPLRLRKFLTEIAFDLRKDGFYLLSRFPIDDEKIGPSPTHWDAPWAGRAYLREEMFQCLVSAGIGSLFGWRTQENGRLLRHVVPIEADEDEQLGGSSSTPLLWHTEEAFHPAKADYVSLMCYRNFEFATTMLANVRELELDPRLRDVLCQERFVIEPDKSHFPENNRSSHWDIEDERFAAIKRFLSRPRKCAILHGAGETRTMVVDQAFVSAVEGDGEAASALAAFHRALDAAASRIEMRQGDLLIVDNLTTAHGRSVYRPHYGPKQRWMRRVNIRNGRRSCMQYQEPNNPWVMA